VALGVVEGIENRGVDVGGGFRIVVWGMRLSSDEGEVHVAVGSDEGEGRRLRRSGGAVLDGEE